MIKKCEGQQLSDAPEKNGNVTGLEMFRSGEQNEGEASAAAEREEVRRRTVDIKCSRDNDDKRSILVDISCRRTK